MRQLLLCILLLWLFIPSAAHAQIGNCSFEVVNQNVVDLIQDNSPGSQYNTVMKQVKMGITKGYIRGEYRDQAAAAMLEYLVRLQNKCPIPEDLSLATTRMLKIVDSDGKICNVQDFKTIVERQHRSLYGSSGYAAFEAMIKEQVAVNVISPMKEEFIAKWDRDPTFRGRVIRAGLEMTAMASQGCANIQDPVLGVINSMY